MTKKDYYKKKHFDCPCCGWRGHVNRNMRKWLGRHEINTRSYIRILSISD